MLITVLGSLLIAFGPPVAFFYLVLSRRATLVILTIGSAFSWLCGLFLASIVWWVLEPFREVYAVTVPVAVLSTECMRYLFWLIWTKGHQSLNQDAGKKLEDEMSLFAESISAGMGAGICSSLMYAGVLWSAWGPGVLLNSSCFGASIYLVGAVASLLNNILLIQWAILAHDAYRRGSWLLALLVGASHLFSSLMSIFNSGQFGSGPAMCLLSFAVQILSIALLGFVLWRRNRALFASRKRRY